MVRSNENSQNTHRIASTNNQNNVARNPHYENIYESIDQFATVNAPAPAENIQNAQLSAANTASNSTAATTSNNNNNNGNNTNNASNNGRINLRNRNQFHYNASTISHSRNVAYDVPRHARNYYTSNAGNRRATLEANTNRIRYANANRAFRQRSFDDTESYHYSPNNNFRYENIYEQIREEPIYRNIGLSRDNAANRLYGRLDVIGHGIGRIERHLSSSCGNIDHYNLGGTYAILGHSHLSTVGHVYASNNAKESAGKSLNFFSCLGRENSQSMSNICRESSNTNSTTETASGATAPPPAQNDNGNKNTGAIPKIKNKIQSTATNANAKTNTTKNTLRPAQNSLHSNALNRISKSSLQWLLMNKWLPLWIGNGSDCNVLDFNFMFSRNCDGCDRDDNVILYDQTNGAAYANNNARENYYTFARPVCPNNTLMRFNEANSHRMYGTNRHANYRPNEGDNSGYETNDIPYNFRVNTQPENPFRRWELNSENNSFRPASVRRITDGTFPNGNNQNLPFHVGFNHRAMNANSHNSTFARASTSKDRSVAGKTTFKKSTINNGEASSSSLLRSDRRAFENAALSSSTESASEYDNKILSPDLSARRYSENTEDDQYNSGNTSSDEDGNDETISELNTNDTDNSERINE